MEVADFKDKHRGERCFVLGCGPSLSKINLDLIANEVSFAMNNICLIYPQTKWRPTYYWSSTQSLNKYPKWLEWGKEAISYGQPSFIGNESPIPDAPNTIRLNIFSVRKPARDTWALPAAIWTTDAAKQIYHYRMSAYGLMQLVQYMGCNPVYMLGFDNNWIAGGPNHFSPDYEAGFEWNEEYVAHETFWQGYAHKKIKMYMDHLGIDVYDCTVGGSLEVYPRVNLEDIL